MNNDPSMRPVVMANGVILADFHFQVSTLFTLLKLDSYYMEFQESCCCLTSLHHVLIMMILVPFWNDHP